MLKYIHLVLSCLFLASFSPAASESSNTNGLIECHPRGGLPNLLAKARDGNALRIAYLGGSITAQNGWRPRTLAWFQKQFSKSTFAEINAAIGGTGSDLGVFRLRQDVLVHNPDLVFVEFAVNDAGASVENIHRCMEGIVRQTWRNNPVTDICFVYTIAGNMLQEMQAGRLPRSIGAMETLAEHYSIPTINMSLEVARLEKAGKLIFKGQKPKTGAEKTALGDKILFSPDAVHPFEDTGHALYLEAVVRSMAQIEKIRTAAPHPLRSPLREDNWESAKLLPLDKATLSQEWRTLDANTNRLARQFRKFLPQLWTTATPGATLQFQFRGYAAKIYDLVGPDCGQLSVQVDDRPAMIQPRFDAYCTYHRLQTLTLVQSTNEIRHTVRVQLIPEPPDKAKILARRNEKIDDPKRFEGINWYAGAILLVGELME